MKKYTLYIIATGSLLLCLPSLAAAGDLLINLEYFSTRDADVIARIIELKKTNTEHKQKIEEDLLTADEGARRTLNIIFDVFKKFELRQYRRVLSWSSRVFSNDFIVPENEESYQSVSLPGGHLDISFQLRRKSKKGVSVGINIHYNDSQIYTDTSRIYPMNRLIMLHESYVIADYDEELNMLFMKITSHKTEGNPEDQARQ